MPSIAKHLSKAATIAVCGVLLLASGARGASFSDGFRWTSTATNGSGLTQGDPTTLLWSIVPDGMNVDGNSSNLVSYLDGLYGTGGAASLADRPWFDLLSDQFENIASKTGLTFQYVSDNGATWNNSPSNGSFGDIRLAGYDLSTSGELGNASLPGFGGDLLLDTANTAFANPTTLSTVFQHELGHALSLLHVSVQGSSVLMNTGTLPINGPQFDDLYALTRLYGDPYESLLGNNTAATATQLPTLTTGVPVEVGTSANGLSVLRDDVDFATIDGTNDTDYYRIQTTTPGELTLHLEPRGPTYTYTPEGLPSQMLVAQEKSNLKLALFAANGTTPLASINATGLGESESLAAFDLPTAGTYYVRVTGQENANQFYHLSATATETTFATKPLVFRDDFAVTTVDINGQTDIAGRQSNGRVDSPYAFTMTQTQNGTPAVQIVDSTLELTTVRGNIGAELAQTAPVRNFGPQVIGKKWLLSLDVHLDASVSSNQALFDVVIDDQWPLGAPLSESAELSFQIASNGAYKIVEHAGNAAGEANSSGIRTGPDYRLQILVDETFATPRVTVAVNGGSLLLNEQITFNSTQRYFSLQSSVLAGLAAGSIMRAEIDSVSIVVLSEALSGDYNFDGVVNLADYTVWRDQLGMMVLAGTSADGNSNGTIDAADYTVWKTHLGASSLAAIQNATVPEPTAALLLITAIPFVVLHRVKSVTCRAS